MREPRRERASELIQIWTLAALLLVGALIRSWAYAQRGAFWTDEAGLALNVVGRGVDQIARPMIYDQYAPYLYLLGEKLLSVLFGPSEYALRLGSLLAGILSLPVIALVAARVAGRSAAVFALLMLVLNNVTIDYSTQFKPYMLDALMAGLLLLFCVPALSPDAPERRALRRLAVAGALAPWFSLPCIFTLAAVGCALLVDVWARRLGARALLARCAVGGAFLLSFAVHYLLFLRAGAQSQTLQVYWAKAGGFAPFPPHSLEELRWYPAKAFYLFSALISSGGFGLRYVAAATWLIGLCLLWRKSRALAVLFALPAPLMFAASAAHKYIIADRMVLFLLPVLIVPVAVALSACAGSLRLPLAAAGWPGRRLRSQQLLAFGLAAAFCLAPLPRLSFQLSQLQPDGPDIRNAVEHLKRHFQQGDLLYVETQVEWIYAFYSLRDEFRATWASSDGRSDRAAALATLDALQGAPRVWALLPHLGRTHVPNSHAAPQIARAEQSVTQRLDHLGRKLAALDAGDTRLYLYDLSEPQATR
jgi:hypothetical protein